MSLHFLVTSSRVINPLILTQLLMLCVIKRLIEIDILSFGKQVQFERTNASHVNSTIKYYRLI